ncbi:MAG TPA: tripartite tricarboxylate transporter substrate binding protein [Xanthobacteraceae bacterium]|jgi:tripartite-type tricarboxylate transporter receptor subunit TctC
MTDRRTFMTSALALPVMAAGRLGLHAEEAWPARTITIVVPFPAGGVADYAARPLAAFLSARLGKNVVVENKGGAGGGIGHAYVARAEPDGYTIMTALPSLAVIPEANRLAGKAATYEVDQFVPLARLLADPAILAVHKSAPWNSVDQLIADVRNNPGQIPYGTSGHLGTVHLAMEMFLAAAQLKMVHVPYQGGGPSFSALLSRQVPIVPTLVSTAKGQIDAGNIRVLAQWGTERLPSLPQVPTFQEAGYPDVVYILWTGVFAPRQIPAQVVGILRNAIRAFMQDKTVVQRLEQAGSQVSYLDGPEFETFLQSDTDRLLKIVRQIGLS